MDEAQKAARINSLLNPKLIYVVMGNGAVVGTSATFKQMEDAGWFAKAPALAFYIRGNLII
jgi:hypothetical protein